MNEDEVIHIESARTHNLQNVTVDIPRNELVVVTGVSGSGKSSLAFDTLYAEGQRRYVESLSAYARQFLGRMQKPDVEKIEGIPPAIAIQQKVTSRNPRSTVGTVTEIYDYLKLLYARVGHTISPVSKEEVKRHSVQDVVNAYKQLPEGTKVYLLAPTELTASTLEKKKQQWLDEGLSRLWIDHQVVRLEDELPKNINSPIYLLIDRLVSDHTPTSLSRLADSVQTAFFEGNGSCVLVTDEQEQEFSSRFERDGITFMEPSEHLFDFNSPVGACPCCHGQGFIAGIDPNLVVPDKTKSIYEGALVCWKSENMKPWLDALIYNAQKFDFPIHTPFYQLTEDQRLLLWQGNEYFKGLNEFFQVLEKEQYKKLQYRVILSRYKGKTTCPECKGLRLRKESEYVYIDGKNIQEVVQMPIKALQPWFGQLPLTKTEQLTAEPLLKEITSRLQFMEDVGLSYLTLNRMSNSLSGGESQRINLAKSLGSSLVGSLYVLDEPSIGLHARDTHRLIHVLKDLRDLGNTIVVVEHDEEIIQAADTIIEIGPKAGRLGGKITYCGKPPKMDNTWSIPPFRRPWNNYIEVIGACENNLKNLTVRFPLNVMTVITGVSGSGKSSLVSRVLFPALCNLYGGVAENTGNYSHIQGSTHLIRNVEFVDQNPLSRSSRSNPVTYLKAFDEIRKLFAEQPLAQQMEYTPAHFSFNTPGGRCEQCEGEGFVTIQMQFMADLILECEQCHGKRYKQDILDVLYRGQSIYDILQMTVDQAIEFFSEDPKTKKIVQRLRPLQEVGLGYIQLGQSSSTLSGGEAQRVKLAGFLSQESQQPTLFIFDEPTTGLHSKDISTLLKAFQSLISKGHTLIIIEHNPHIILAADHIIDLGPEGGEEGGHIVFEGTPEQLALCEQSYTGQFIKTIYPQPKN